jgi:hypothetical protein
VYLIFARIFDHDMLTLTSFSPDLFSWLFAYYLLAEVVCSLALVKVALLESPYMAIINLNEPGD